MNRRKILYAAAAVTAGLTGVAFALKRKKPHSFFRQAFTATNGQTVEMSHFLGQPLLLNFWATWCPPCVEELPLLNQFYQDHKANGWQVLGVAVDRLDAVQRFLKSMPLSFPVVISSVDGFELSRSLGNTVSALPFSVVFDKDGQVVFRVTGPVSEQYLSNLSQLR